MSVEPGFGGQSFIPEVLDKVRAARRLVDAGHLTMLVEIDGGINADTIEAAAEAGVDCFVAGSAVYGADDPAPAVEALRDRVRAASAPWPHERDRDAGRRLVEAVDEDWRRAPDEAAMRRALAAGRVACKGTHLARTRRSAR